MSSRPSRTTYREVHYERPSSGGSGSGSTSKRHSRNVSDSGIGTSDTDSTQAHLDRWDLSARDIEEQYNDVAAVRDALRAKDDRIRRLERSLKAAKTAEATTRKECREVESAFMDVHAERDTLEAEVRNLHADLDGWEAWAAGIESTRKPKVKTPKRSSAKKDGGGRDGDRALQDRLRRRMQSREAAAAAGGESSASGSTGHHHHDGYYSSAPTDYVLSGSPGRGRRSSSAAPPVARFVPAAVNYGPVLVDPLTSPVPRSPSVTVPMGFPVAAAGPAPPKRRASVVSKARGETGEYVMYELPDRRGRRKN